MTRLFDWLETTVGRVQKVCQMSSFFFALKVIICDFALALLLYSFYVGFHWFVHVLGNGPSAHSGPQGQVLPAPAGASPSKMAEYHAWLVLALFVIFATKAVIEIVMDACRRFGSSTKPHVAVPAPLDPSNHRMSKSLTQSSQPVEKK